MARNTGKRPGVRVASLMSHMMPWEGARGASLSPAFLPPRRAVLLVGFCGTPVLGSPWQGEVELGRPARAGGTLESLWWSHRPLGTPDQGRNSY